MQTAELPRTVIAGPAPARSAGLERFLENAASSTRQERIVEADAATTFDAIRHTDMSRAPLVIALEREIRARRDALCARQRGWEDFDIPGDGYCAGEEGSTSVRSGP